MIDTTATQAERLSLLARDLTLFPESRDTVLSAYNISPAQLKVLEENPIFQASVTHAYQQLLDDPLYSRRLVMAAKASVLAEKLLGEAIGGLMEHTNSIKVLDFAAKIANMEPPKVTKASTDNKNVNQNGILDPSMFKNAAKALSDKELEALEALLTKMGQSSLPDAK